MGSTFANLLTHFIFSTKNRGGLIPSDRSERLHAYMGGIIRNVECVLLAAGGTANHVHLLVSRHPTVSESVLMREVKTNSSRWFRQTCETRDFAWQDGFGAFSVSKSSAEAVRQYIANQEEHHRSRSFEEEFTEFLERHGVEYDPRYVLD